MRLSLVSGLFAQVGFRREHDLIGNAYLVVQGKSFREGHEAFVDGDRVYLHSGFPGQPPRQIAGPGKAIEDAIILLGLLTALVALIVSAL
jgi:hypothetical protein